MSDNDKCPSRNFGNSLQLTNWIQDSRETCHITPQVSDFISGSLEYTDKHIEITGGHHVTAKPKGQVQIKMCGDNGDLFIATFHNLLLAPDLCNRLFSIITILNSGHTCLFNKGFCTVYFGDKEKNAVTLPHSAQRKNAFLGEIKLRSKSNKFKPRKQVAL